MTRRRHVAGADIDLAGWPGAWLRRSVARWLPGSALHEVVDALLADLHAEWADMRREGRAFRALWLALQIRAYIVANVVYIALPGIAIATLRRVLISAAALLVTVGLMLAMHAMVRGSGERGPAPPPAQRIVLLAPAPAEAQPASEAELVALPRPPIEPVGPPDRNKLVIDSLTRPRTGGDDRPGVEIGVISPIVPPPISVSDTDVSCVPLVRIEPQYPRRGRGTEGSVLVELRIDPAGVVQEATILSAEPPGMFDRAVLRAVRKWRYLANLTAPPGAPHPCDGSQVRLTFELADS